VLLSRYVFYKTDQPQTVRRGLSDSSEPDRNSERGRFYRFFCRRMETGYDRVPYGGRFLERMGGKRRKQPERTGLKEGKPAGGSHRFRERSQTGSGGSVYDLL